MGAIEETATLDATATAELIRDRQISPAEAIEAAIGRIEQLNPELNAVIHPMFEKALDGAEGLADGPFRGVPMVLKDLLAHSAGDPLHEGTRFLRDQGWIEDSDQELVRRYRAAGFAILGKTNTPELGILPTTEPEAYGPTRNPWDTGRSTGGSSGGSAAAVAAAMVPVGHANDGGGSIRIPAAHCGLVGLKPSRARNSLGPDFGDVMTGLVAEHVVTRSVRDSAAILDLTRGLAPGDPYDAPGPERPYAEEAGADPGQLRIGLMTAAPAGQFEVAPECAAAAEATGGMLSELGHEVSESHPPELDDPDYTDRFIRRWTAGIAWNIDYWQRTTGKQAGAEDFEASTWALAEMGRGFSAPEYLSALEYQQKASREAARWWADGFDLLLTPTCGEPPAPIGSFDPEPGDPTSPITRSIPTAGFTAFWNTTGQPAISLPLHQSDEGLPIGVQLVAALGREDLLIRIAAQLEEAHPWADRTPSVFAA